MPAKMKIIVRNAQLKCFDGAKVPNGTEITRDELRLSRTGQIMLTGFKEDSKEPVQVMITAKKDGVPEFRAMVDIIEREGVLECEGEINESMEVDGVIQEFYHPRVELNLTNADGTQNFTYTPKTAPKWAEKYGDWKTPCVDYGKDVEASARFATMKRERRTKAKGSL